MTGLIGSCIIVGVYLVFRESKLSRDVLICVCVGLLAIETFIALRIDYMRS